MSEQTSAWGRIDADGTVYVRTADGERAVGSWHAGSPEDGLAYFARRYDDLVTEVGLLEHRLRGDAGDADAVAAKARLLRDSLDTAAVVGDLAAVARRLDALLAAAAARREQAAVEGAARAERALAAKRALAAEAEQLAAGSEWKRAGDRLRAIGDEWRALRGGDRRTDSELWARVTAAREAFAKRRSEHFAALDEKRREAAAHKEQLVREAEELSGSTDWGPTAARYKELMAAWKAAGVASKGAEDALWARFRAAQDAFFGRRSQQFAERDVEFRGNQEAKEKLLAEAEALDPDVDLDAAQRRLREIQDRWEAIGKVPRDAVARLEGRMAAVEQRVRDAVESRWRRPDPAASPLVVRLRESVAALEAKLERARAAGRSAEAEEYAAKLATQREWLAQAERAGG